MDETSYKDEGEEDGEISPILIVVICLAVFLIAVAAATIVLLKKPQRK